MLYENTIQTSIVTETTVANYTHILENSIAQIRIDLQDIEGDHVYVLRVYINDVPMIPGSSVSIGPGIIGATIQSRSLILRQNDVIRVAVIGGASDILATVTTIIANTAQPTADELIEALRSVIINTIASEIENIVVRPERVVLGPIGNNRVRTILRPVGNNRVRTILRPVGNNRVRTITKSGNTYHVE